MAASRYISGPLRLFTGETALSALPGELRRAGLQRAVVFCGRSLATTGTLARVETALGDLHAASFAAVKAHSPLPDVEQAASALRAARADAIVVLGGGSAVITARAAAILLGENRPLKDLATRLTPAGDYESPRLHAPKLPLYIVPSTPNSAYVKAGAGVFDPEIGERRAVFDPQTRARAIFLDPAILLAAPEALVTGASLDNLFLAAEGLLSGAQNAIAEGELTQSLYLIEHHLRALATGAGGMEHRRDLTLAGILAGRGTDYARAGACTALGHAIGANFDCDNAVVKAVLWPHILRFNGSFAAPGLRVIARALNLPEGQGATAFAPLFDALQLPRSLRAFGIAADDLPDIAARAMKDWFMGGNCRPVPGATSLLPVLQAAL